MSTAIQTVEELAKQEYKYGFTTDVETDAIPVGLNEDVIAMISAKKDEPAWLLDWRLNAFRVWSKMTEPTWHNVRYPPVDYQAISYYAAPKKKPQLESLDEVDPEIRATFDKLGISLDEQKRLSGVAVDAVFDSVSVATTFKDTLADLGIIFCSFSEAVRDHPELVRKYLGTVVPHTDNFFAALNSAVFSDGSFAYIPRGVKCPMELSTYFRINAANTGQFERTLLVADEGAEVSYLEGCTAPQRDENQLHAAVVELVALERRRPSSTRPSRTGTPVTRTARAGSTTSSPSGARLPRLQRSKISWTQVETGSAITWKYPSCILQGDERRRRVLLGGDDEQPAAGRHRHEDDPPRKEHPEHDHLEGHLGRARPDQSYRGLVRRWDRRGREGARNYSQCDSLLLGDRMRRPHLPLPRGEERRRRNRRARGHDIEDQRRPALLLPPARPLRPRTRSPLIVHGFCK